MWKTRTPFNTQCQHPQAHGSEVTVNPGTDRD